jgi:FAD/FMN-containing dehydrogenase
VTTTGRPTAIDEAAVATFEARLHGPLLRRGHAVYEDARRVWNGMIERRPALIARCTGAADVIACVAFAREHDLLVSVRGGGHNVAGHAVCEGGLMIDLSPMKGVWVDPQARTTRVQAGCTWADVDRETQLFGLATPGGVVSETGVAGLTLSGELAWQRRAHGMTIDNLISADVVTAQGELIRASATENPELFWGLRGGGGNFGIVTSFEYQLHELGPDVMLVEAMYPLEEAPQVLRAYREFVANAPDAVTADILAWSIPAAPEIPEELHGVPFVAVEAFYTGPAEEGARVLQPLRELGTPLLDMSGIRPYLEVQSMFDVFFPTGLRYYWKSIYLDDLRDDLVDLLISRTADRPSPLTLLSLRHLGGAIGRVPAGATAFGDRSAEFLLSFDSIWESPEDDAVNIAWTRDAWEQARQHSNGKMYFNFPGLLEEGESLLRTSYGEGYERLVALKEAYDPTNLFRLNQNIQPRKAPVAGGA